LSTHVGGVLPNVLQRGVDQDLHVHPWRLDVSATCRLMQAPLGKEDTCGAEGGERRECPERHVH
jgi:hypothetical protein